MKLLVIAVGQRVPDWTQTAWDDYAKRFPLELKVELKTVKTEPRTNNKNTASLMQAERERIEAVLAKEGKDIRLVVLDERGKATSTQQLAQRLTDWQLGGTDVALIIGGPDGLEPGLKKSAPESLRLSDMTLPHAFVRVLLVEQLYRAWSVNAGHPYHRE
jgi:23S rRNA (pseudouridine1915-N3)-methyltransferase